MLELEGDRDPRRAGPEGGREPDDGPVRRLALRDEADALRNGGEEPGDEQAPPALAERDGRGGGEQHGDEASPDEGELLVLDDGHERDEHGADEPERGDELGTPREGHRRRAGGDQAAATSAHGSETNP